MTLREGLREPIGTHETTELSTKVDQPASGDSSNHVAGMVEGTEASYDDLNAFAWYPSGGWSTRNRGRKGLRRTMRGLEDVSRRQG